MNTRNPVPKWAIKAALVVVGAIALSPLLVTCATAAPREVCSWDTPGQNKFRGSAFRAVMSYEHIPVAVRIRLALVANRGEPGYRAAITRSGLESNERIKFDAGADVNDMHFGRSEVCMSVARRGWADDHYEMASFWCEGVYCIGSPDVCGNIFWTRRVPPAQGVGRAMHVPEPGSIALLGVGLIGLLAVRRR